jgi:hypothetical protein
LFVVALEKQERRMSTFRVLTADREAYFGYRIKTALDAGSQNGTEFLLCKASEPDNFLSSASFGQV